MKVHLEERSQVVIDNDVTVEVKHPVHIRKQLADSQTKIGGMITAEDFAKGLAAVIEETGYAKY